ncbi:filamentous hemagglutinin N-terminal domain-containing protein [Arsenophonus nasoniae]|uniref:Filamentous hemagglutinin N-terminal domain-containing protein n=1 Tax=Arsenophonus nasoniae TaxID=638 RepID=A0AA95KDH9_9GAMM|nr:filamentous hemagglutinin N-terminal domain-containing protein [Arsenophonus nasoniae]WGM01464.1 filamentous hemagglutinin N-terminal domain-containing protein [Arsenophonus nasoniae]
MRLSKNNNLKLALLTIMVSISFSGNIFASKLSGINNNSTPLKQPTEIVSSNGKINLNSVNKSLTIDILPAVSHGQFKISHNKYDKFNVSENGIKINNATNNPANIIITEVISAEKSNINGNIAILGNNKPQLIIANPNGINCSNHCSFTNADRVSLVTYPIETKIPSNHLTNNIRGKHIHFKNIKQGKFTDAKTIQLLARSVTLESSHLNVNNITIAVHDTHIISNIFTTINNINATKFINITDDILQNIILAKNANLTIDSHSAINSKYSHYEITNGEFYNNGTINNTEILVITGINSTIDNQEKIKSKNSHFLIRNGKFNNNGTIQNTEIAEIFADNADINNQSKIKSKIGLYEIKDGTFYNSGIMDHSQKVTIKGNNAYIVNQFILTSPKYDLTKLKSSKFLDFSFVLPHKRNANSNIELDLSKNIM